jgi:hypothetical protein
LISLSAKNEQLSGSTEKRSSSGDTCPYTRLHDCRIEHFNNPCHHQLSLHKSMSSSATLILDKRTQMIGQISELSIVNSPLGYGLRPEMTRIVGGSDME